MGYFFVLDPTGCPTSLDTKFQLVSSGLKDLKGACSPCVLLAIRQVVTFRQPTQPGQPGDPGHQWSNI